MKYALVVFRYVSTLAIIYMAYRETGVWTGISLLLIFAALEAQTYVNSANLKAWKHYTGIRKF